MDILYQDDSIVVVNKPSGLLTIRDGYNPDLPSVKSLLEENYGRCWIVHRLDKETSGVLIVALNAIAHRILNTAFQNHQIQKSYHAIINGIPVENEFEINLPLKVDGDRKHRTTINSEKGKSAKSLVIVLERFNQFSLIEVKPESGYTHQIRTHLSYSGFPIIGDLLYQKNNSAHFDLINRTALHAYQITFFHPLSNIHTTIQADYPHDFAAVLTTISR